MGLARSASAPILFRFVQSGKLLAQIFYLGKIVEDDVRLIGMMGKVVLMVAFGFIKRLEGADLSYDGPSENFRVV